MRRKMREIRQRNMAWDTGWVEVVSKERNRWKVMKLNEVKFAVMVTAEVRVWIML
jgi:hypothetical protein